MDKVARTGIRVQDLFDEKLLHEKIEHTLTNRNQIFVKVFNRMPFDPDKVTEELPPFAEPLRGYVADTGLLLNKALDAKQAGFA